MEWRIPYRWHFILSMQKNSLLVWRKCFCIIGHKRNNMIFHIKPSREFFYFLDFEFSVLRYYVRKAMQYDEILLNISTCILQYFHYILCQVIRVLGLNFEAKGIFHIFERERAWIIWIIEDIKMRVEAGKYSKKR